MTDKSNNTGRHVLLLHGANCGGDVWTPVARQLERRGWKCTVPTLLHAHRPLSAASGLSPEIGLSDYIAQARELCRDITQRTGRPPAVVGHSMGGLIAQVLADEGVCSCAAFVVPAAPKGVPGFSLWAIVLFANALISRRTDKYHKPWKTGVNAALLNRVPSTRRDAIYARMRLEPGRLLSDMNNGLHIRRDGLNVPTLVVGAGRDRIVPVRITELLSQYYAPSARPCETVHAYVVVACHGCYGGCKGGNSSASWFANPR